MIGIDFDNTLVNYDGLMHRIALEKGLIGAEVSQSKMAVRDAIRRLPDGEVKWQTLQGAAYGPEMKGAQLAAGAADFIAGCRAKSMRLCVVSHKTEFANYDATGTNLRESASAWMSENRFFESDGLGFDKNDVFFESSRKEKLERIASLQCTHFIDDLEEVLQDADFPLDVEKILFSPGSTSGSENGMTVSSSWEAISRFIFDGDR